MNRFVVSTTLPDSSESVDFVVQTDAIALRIGERVCVAHHRWMSVDEAREMANAVLRLTGEEDV